ncbi:MAG TPA: isoprenylcysteine carboxylmethyltransferase family protein [Chthoniobacteraceae bacterium]|nr:isoprenylcysteine carboxylmethyltransferase family protein [Chthoniobacteraceae bacterium]
MNTFLYILPPLAAALAWAERMREVRTKRATVPGPRREVLSFRLFMTSGLVMFAGGIVEFFIWQPPFSLLRFLAGVVLTITSFVIRRKAIAALGRFWSLHVEMREGHEFVQSGPFRWMRHPVYFSMILELLGTAFMLGSWRALAVASLIFIPTLIWRVRTEEEALITQFGPAYEAYRRSTGMIFPWRGPHAT